MGYFSTLKTVLFSPLDVPDVVFSEDGYLDATLFALASLALSLAFWIIAGAIASLVTGSWHIIAVIGIFSAATLILFTPLLHLMALLYHAACKILGGDGEYSETFRAIAYTYGPIATTIIPIFHLFAGLWILILHGIVLKEVHDLTDLRAILAVIMVAAVYMILGAVISVLFILSRKEVFA